MSSVLYIEDNTVNTMLVARILRSRPAVRLESAPDESTGYRNFCPNAQKFEGVRRYLTS